VAPPNKELVVFAPNNEPEVAVGAPKIELLAVELEEPGLVAVTV